VANRLLFASERGFEQSSADGTGSMLAVLAAAVRRDGRILEIGTGAGVGLAWIVDGLGHRDDVEVVTIDIDTELVAAVAAGDWPHFVRFTVGDALELIPTLGPFDLIFADAAAGKWYGLANTIDALTPGGVVVVDDMSPVQWADDEHELRTREVRAALLQDSRLVAAELQWASGLIVATRRSP
jgi:demethylmenaquinone methyltransferase/2-methoxy-6-polyprenyl-1,4-benzoquinol methylase